MAGKKISFISAGLAGITLLFFFASADIENGGGAPAGRTGSPGDGANCTGCHSGAAQNVAGLITTDIPASGYIPGNSYTITGTISDPTRNKFGFQVSPQSLGGTKLGTLTVTDITRTQLVGSGKYVTHKSAGTAGISNAATWSFQWTAPAAGTGQVGFYGAFLAANANSSTSGDVVSLSSLMVNEDLTAGVEENPLAGLRVFPVPASDKLFFSFPAPLKNGITIRMFSLKGELVKEEFFTNPPERISIDISTLNAGMYLAQIASGTNKLSTRFIRQN